MRGKLLMCVFLVLSNLALSISEVSDNVVSAPALVVDANDIEDENNDYEIQSDIDQPKWINIFKVFDADVKEKETNGSDLFTFSQISAVPTKQASGVIRYTIGKRLSNDRLVGHGADSKRWSVPQDVTLALRYPNTGQGALVTYAEIVVDQSSNLGEAHVIAGGIGQRNIAIAVEAKSTLWFSYTANIYGI